MKRRFWPPIGPTLARFWWFPRGWHPASLPPCGLAGGAAGAGFLRPLIPGASPPDEVSFSGGEDEVAYKPVDQTASVGSTEALNVIAAGLMVAKAEDVAVDPVGEKGRFSL